MTFVDTSAILALLDEDDRSHAAAQRWFAGEVDSLATHNYVVVESAALVQRRLGAAAVRALFEEFLPSLNVSFVVADLHDRAVAAFLAGLSRKVSFVDRVSFQFMRSEGIRDAFAFDRDFAAEGFRVVP